MEYIKFYGFLIDYWMKKQKEQYYGKTEID